MNSLAEVEAAIPQLSAEELGQLERFVRKTQQMKTKAGGRSALDLPPVELGRMLKRLVSRQEWYDENAEGPGVTHGRIANRLFNELEAFSAPRAVAE